MVCGLFATMASFARRGSAAWICRRWGGPGWRQSRLMWGRLMPRRPRRPPSSASPMWGGQSCPQLGGNYHEVTGCDGGRTWSTRSCRGQNIDVDAVALGFFARSGTWPSHSVTSRRRWSIRGLPGDGSRADRPGGHIEAAGDDKAAVGFLAEIASGSCSSRISPRISSTISSMVTMPAVLPYSSTTIAMCVPSSCISRIRSFTGLVSGTERMGRMRSRTCGWRARLHPARTYRAHAQSRRSDRWIPHTPGCAKIARGSPIGATLQAWHLADGHDLGRGVMTSRTVLSPKSTTDWISLRSSFR